MAETLTVRTALELEVFRRTTVRVFAGHDHLDRPVRWVHAGEIPDIHRFLTGEEMLLTAGLGMGSTAAEQRAFVRRLAEAHAAVLVIELAGRVFSEMPDAVVDEARAAGLPLVGLADEIPFVEASAQIHEMQMKSRVDALIAEEATGQAFLDLLLAGEDYVGMVGELARRTGYPVVLEDVAHRMLAYGGASPEADAIVAEWGTHSRAVHERHSPLPGDRRKFPSFREVVACSRHPVVLRGESWGYLHVLHGESRPSDADLRTLERAAAAVAITLLSDRESSARAAQRQTSLLNRLLLGDIGGEKFVSRSLSLGRDLRGRDLIAVVAERADGEPDLAAALEALGWPAVAGTVDDADLAVAGIPPGESDARLVSELDSRGLSGGVSRAGPPAALAAAVRQARNAAAVADGKVLRFGDLGALRLLASLAEGPELARYVEDELGPLLEHDARSGNPLLPTLRAFLNHGGNKVRAAEALFVQRRTLYHRLDRIAEILGLDLATVDNQQRVQLAVRGHDLLRRTRPHRT